MSVDFASDGESSPVVSEIRSRVIERNIVNANKTMMFYQLTGDILEPYRTCFNEFLELTDAEKVVLPTKERDMDDIFLGAVLTCELLCSFTNAVNVGYRKEINTIVLFAPTNKRCRTLVKTILLMFRVFGKPFSLQSTETSIIVESENGEKNYLLCLKAHVSNFRFIDRTASSPVVTCTEISKMDKILFDRIEEICRMSNKRLLMLTGGEMT